MNAIVTLEGRRLNAKLTEGWLADADAHARRTDAEHGSLMLKNAILRAKGYHVPEPLPVVFRAPPKPRKFRPRKVKRVGKRGRKASPPSRLIDQIQAIVATYFDLTVEDMVGAQREYDISHPRQLAIYISRQRTAASLAGIGRQFGGKDHTTIRHAVIQVEKRIKGGDIETIEALNFVHEKLGA